MTKNGNVHIAEKNVICSPLRAKAAFVMTFLLMSACGGAYPEARQLAREIAGSLKAQVCHVHFRPNDPCGDRDVRWDADLGDVIYIYVYGVGNPKEMQSAIDLAGQLRDAKNKAIPVYLTFYADLTKSHEVKTIKLKGA